MTSAESYLAKAKAENAKDAQQKRIDANVAGKASGLKVPDLNPADAAVARMQAHAAHLKIAEELLHQPRNVDLRDRVARLESVLQLTLDSLNSATVTCSGGVITITFPSLPT